MITVQKNKNSLCYLYYTVDFFIQSAMLFCLILLVSFVTTVIGKFISLVKQETNYQSQLISQYHHKEDSSSDIQIEPIILSASQSM